MSRVGELLGNYRLLRLLGEGGFAEVYLGEHVRLGTLAALKILHANLSGSDVDAFLKEAQTIARLEHPHIVRVLDYDVQDGVPFLVMGFADGGTLRDLHPRGSRLPLEAVVDYVFQVAEALQYAHDRRVIHRDVKPENLLLGKRREVLLSDFGIALLSSSRGTGTQEVVGTAAYMAPELFHGKPCFASDQYALGVVVYEWLVGERPFTGTFVELASQHLTAPPPPPREINRGISPAVERVVLTALAKDPGQRFGSAELFARALEQACHALSPTVLADLMRQSGWGIEPTIPAVSPAFPARQLVVPSPGACDAVPVAQTTNPPRRRSRHTAVIRAICFSLIFVCLALWLLTIATPPLHSIFAVLTLITIIFWIAAYADHRRATTPAHPRRKRGSLL